MNIIEPTSLTKLVRTNYTSLMEKRIQKILMICSSYDAYTLEEDGQIEAQLQKEYTDLNISHSPSFTWVNTSLEANKLLDDGSQFDLIICMFNLQHFDFFSYTQEIKKKTDNIPIVLLTNYSKELFKKLEDTDYSHIDYIFTWNGNVDLIFAIVKLFEDRLNADNDVRDAGVRAILLVEDSIKYYSTYLPAIYKIILKQSAEFLNEALNEQQIKMIKRARPKILLATNYEDAMFLYERYKKSLLGVISDVAFVVHKDDPPETEKIDAGIELCQHIKNDIPHMPIILQSSQRSISKVAEKMGIGFIEKYSKTLLIQLAEYITEEFAFGDFIVRDSESKEVLLRAKNLKELRSILKDIPDKEFQEMTSQQRLSKWMYSRGLFNLARLLRKIKPTDFPTIAKTKEFVAEQINNYRVLNGQGVIASFNAETYSKYIWFAKLGDDSLGGKARGLAFLNSILVKYDLSNRYEGVKISIPRTIAIATDYFDDFIMENGLQYVINSEISDQELLSEFVSSTLPEGLIIKLKAYIKTVSSPLAVRSSSKLEDSHFQPFAGIYSTYMIPYTENKDQMLRLLGKAIKSVYASVYFAASRSYIHATSNLLSEEKMAVVIQNICGSEDQGYFFPTLSGVAKSMNYYPLEDEKPEEGIVNMGFGLGKLVVEGEKSLRFSPKYPHKALQMTTPRIALKDTQNMMYALDLKPEEFKTSIDEGINLHKFTIPETEGFRNLAHVASTWDMYNDRIVPHIFEKGRRIISFAGILQYDKLPIPQILTDLLTVCKEELKCEVEIEFALNMDVPKGKDAQFNILQVRPIVEFGMSKSFDWETLSDTPSLIYSESALGSGYIEDITDIIYVKEENFDKSKTKEIAEEIGTLNIESRKEGRSFILVGPGRFGSSDPWLGIPTSWNHISEAKVIVECGMKDFNIDPSQGTHFFQNITSLGVGYLTINPFRGEGSFSRELLDGLESDYDSHFLKRVKFPSPPSVYIDGKDSKAIILMPEKKRLKKIKKD